MSAASTLIVIAKAPRPGHSKTRLCPPCTPQQAADLALAALRDTLTAVLRTPGVDRRVLVLDGKPGAWVPASFEVLPQRGDGLDERLAAAFDDVGDPALLVGMDTPQISPSLLRAGLDALDADPAALGPAPDGGYWAIGLREPDAEVFRGVPMSTAHTCAAQRARLDERGLSWAELPLLRDVDRIEDAHAVAALAPEGRFARTLDALGEALVP